MVASTGLRFSATNPRQMKNQKAETFPLTLERGTSKVRIYRSNRSENRFTLSYYLAGKRIRKSFNDLSRAKAEGQVALTHLFNGEAEALKLNGRDRAVYVHAVNRLSRLGRGYTLFEAVEEFVQAKEQLATEAPLWEVTRAWARQHSYPERTPGQVLEELIEVKREAGFSGDYLKDLARLRRFTRDYDLPIVEINSSQVDSFLVSLKLQPRTRNNYRLLLGIMFNFAVKRGYLPKDHDVIGGVQKAKVISGDISIFTPEELKQLFDTIRPEMVPYLAIAAFAGLRKAEIERLDWSEINLSDRVITVTAAKAKTASRRLAPVSDNLFRWLSPYEQRAGRVVPYDNVSKQLTEVLAPKAGVTWKRNALRHSFISYRLALVKNVQQVAFEAGNSSNIIFKHYRELVTEQRADTWFSIEPTG